MDILTLPQALTMNKIMVSCRAAGIPMSIRYGSPQSNERPQHIFLLSPVWGNEKASQGKAR